MNKDEQERMQFQARTIIEDAIDNLRILGASNQTALKLLMVQAAIRMSSTAEVRETMKSISDGLTEDDVTGDDGGVHWSK
jgi:hypothetical protein